MQSHASPGLVLRRRRHKEDDVRLTLFLKDLGKVLVLAKGGQKFLARLRALQEPFTEADYHVSIPAHGTSGRLLGGQLVRSHSQLTRTWDVFMMASRVCEVTEALLPYRAPSPDVFDILRGTLLALEHGGPPALHWIFFGARMLHCLGYGDESKEILKLLHPGESAKMHGSLLEPDCESAWRNVSDSSLNRCQALVDARVSHLLPWQLKSEMLVVPS